jgi:hypothetical protein
MHWVGYASHRVGPLLLAAAALASTATAAEHIVGVRYEQPGVRRIAVTESAVTRTDWTCPSAASAAAIKVCRHPVARTRSWALSEDDHATIAKALAQSDFLAVDATGEARSPGRKAEAVIAVTLKDAETTRVVQRTATAEAPADGAFAAAAGALAELAPPEFSAPATFSGISPHGADIALVLDADGTYRLSLQVVSQRARPAGKATESGRWQLHPDTSTLRLSPADPAGQRRTAQLTGGSKPGAILDLNGYFPQGTTATLAQRRN